MKDLQKIKEFFSKPLEEDAVDTITMDIPLFLRMLEYSREDASQDMDLHDVTEKANTLGKERGTLTMDDYDAIIGAVEEIKLTEVNLKKGDIVNFANGNKIYIIGPKGDGYEFKTDDNQRSFQLKKWFDMMLSSGKASVDEIEKDENQFRHEQGLKETLVKRVMEKLSKL